VPDYLASGARRIGYALAVKVIEAVAVLPAASVIMIVAVNDDVVPQLIPLVSSAKVTGDDQLVVPVVVTFCGQVTQLLLPPFRHLPSNVRLDIERDAADAAQGIGRRAVEGGGRCFRTLCCPISCPPGPRARRGPALETRTCACDRDRARFTQIGLMSIQSSFVFVPVSRIVSWPSLTVTTT
jgi:hypothetical protein